MADDFEFGCPLSDERVSFLSTVDVGLGSDFDAVCELVLESHGPHRYVSDIMRRSLSWVMALNAEYGGVASHAGSQMVFGWALAEALDLTGREREVLTPPIRTFRGLP